MKKNVFLLIFLFVLFLSCSHEKQFPEHRTKKVLKEQLTINISDFIPAETLINDSLKNSELPDCLEQISLLDKYYNNKEADFNFDKLEKTWEECSNTLNYLALDETGFEMWVEATGLLLQLTAEAKYAEELERIFYSNTSSKIKEEVAGYAITKNVDHLHINLFLPAKIEYEHSLRGLVTVLIETSYPKEGKVDLIFSMEKKRYVELFIRIPSRAKAAHVTAGGVKYLAPAGEYCKIAKQWREGDSVQIEFPGINE